MSDLTNLMNRRELLRLGGAALASASLGRAADDYRLYWGP